MGDSNDSSDSSDLQYLHKSMYEWTQYDKQLKELNKQSKDIRKKRDGIQSKLCTIIKNNNLENNVFSIQSLGTNVSYKVKHSSEGITQSFLHKAFTEYFDTPEDAEKLMEFLKTKRTKTEVHILCGSDIKEE